MKLSMLILIDEMETLLGLIRANLKRNAPYYDAWVDIERLNTLLGKLKYKIQNGEE
jgi:hypothetical protein